MAAKISEASGVACPGLAGRLEKDFRACGLPTESPVSPAALVEAMTKDKKSEAGLIHFILTGDIGHVEEKTMAAAEAVRLLEQHEQESGHLGKYI